MIVSTGVTSCPRCESADSLVARRYSIKSQLVQEYGALDMERWLDLRRELESLPASGVLPKTLHYSSRYGVEKGSFSFDFSSECTSCGWRFDFNPVKIDLKSQSSGKGVYSYEISGGEVCCG